VVGLGTVIVQRVVAQFNGAGGAVIKLDMPVARTPDSYPQFLAELKKRIQGPQIRASLAVNRDLVFLYWQIGREILARQERERWGAKVIDRLAIDLKRAFPDMKGFSPRNLTS
jgi:hypothetical protein